MEMGAEFPVTLESTAEPHIWRVSVMVRDMLCVAVLPLPEGQAWVAALVREARKAA